MKNFSSITNKIVSRSSPIKDVQSETKSTNINILLNRVKLVKKNESRKKVLFTAATSLGVVLFGIFLF